MRNGKSNGRFLQEMKYRTWMHGGSKMRREINELSYWQPLKPFKCVNHHSMWRYICHDKSNATVRSFLQYIIKQDGNSMIYRILKATEENPIKCDFVITCKKYMETLKLKITFKDIENLTKLQFREILKEKNEVPSVIYKTICWAIHLE